MAFTIVSDTCEGMGECRTVCPVECIVKVVVAKDDAVRAISAIDPERCTDCGACRSVCPIHGAILNEWHPDRQAVIPTSKGSGRTALEEAQTRLAAEFDVAIAMGNSDALRRLLANEGPQSTFEAAPHLLHLAASLGDKACCRVLLAFGFAIDRQDETGTTPLIAAITREHARQIKPSKPFKGEAERAADVLETCRFLLEQGADPSIADLCGKTPLHHAAQAWPGDLVWLLVDYGAVVNRRDSTYRTPLHWAAEGGTFLALAGLLSAGSDPSLCDENEMTPLELTPEGPFIRAAAALTFASGPLHPKLNPLALHALAFAESLDRLDQAIAGGADLHARDHRGRTALHWAAIAGRSGAAAMLVDAGARPDLLDATDASPIDYAQGARHPERVRQALRIAFRIEE